MERSWSHEYRVPVALFILTSVPIIVIVLLFVIGITDERLRCYRICQRLVAILAGDAIFVPEKFRGTVLSRVLLPRGLYTSRERWTGSAQVPREMDRFTEFNPRDYSPVHKVGEKSTACVICVSLTLCLSLYRMFPRVYRERVKPIRDTGFASRLSFSTGADSYRNYHRNLSLL